MLLVLFILLALTLAVTAYYTQSEDHLFTGQSLSAYAIAASRAEYGAQRAVADIRSGAVNVALITSVCNDAPPVDPFTACAGIGVGNSGVALGSAAVPVDNGPAPDPKNGGGLQYKYLIYKAFMGPVGGPNLAPQNLYTVRSMGYFGYTLASQNLYTSEMEVTVEVGTSTTFKCTSYDCS